MTEMKKVLKMKNLSLIQAEVKEILVENEEIGIVNNFVNQEIFPSKTVIICTGTYLKSIILMGEKLL